MPTDFDQLRATIAVAFDMHPHTLRFRSCHQASGFYVRLSSQADLDVIVSDMHDEGMHALTVEVTGMSANHNIVAMTFWISCLATASQLLYIVDVELDPASTPDYLNTTALIVIAVVLFINTVAKCFLLHKHLAQNPDASRWISRWDRRMLFVVTAPLTIELMPSSSNGAFAFPTAVRYAVQKSMTKCSVLMLVLQDGWFLSLVCLQTRKCKACDDAFETTDVRHPAHMLLVHQMPL